MRSTVLLLALLVALPAAAASQLPAWVRPGARLRVTTAAGEPVVGSLVRADPDSFSLQVGTDDEVTIPLAAVSRMDVSRERGSQFGAGARTGLVVGASFGAVTILSNGDVGNKGLGALVFGGVFGLIGAGVGGLIGSAMPTDVWEPIAVDGARVWIAPTTDRVSVGLSFHL
jgi:hypothetical protein